MHTSYPVSRYDASALSNPVAVVSIALLQTITVDS